jgi:hypothetical protein
VSSTPILVKLAEAAEVYAPLTALLGTAPFRWWNKQLVEGSAYPAITAMKVSGVPMFYNVGGRGPTTVYRVQFTIWEGLTPDDTDAVLQALRTFLDTFSAVENTGQFPNQIVMERDGFYAQTQPGIFQTLVDALIYNADNQ